MSSPTPRNIMATWRAGAVDLWAWLRAPAHRVPAAGVLCLVAASVAYAFVRAVWLESSDLIGGFMFPTRGALLEGKNPFIEYQWNSYPPFFYAVMAPLAVLPDGAVSLSWSALSIALVIGVVALVRDMLAVTSGTPVRSRAWVAPLLAGALLLDNIHLGQSNILPLFLACAAFHLFMRGRDLHGGALVGVAIAFKVTPAIFLGWMVLKRRWLALLGVTLSLVACLVVAPAVVFGPSRAVDFIRGWTALVVKPFVSGEKVKTTNVSWHHTNQSMDAAINRHLTPYGVHDYGGLHQVLDPAFLDEDGARKLSVAIKLMLLAAISLLVLRAGTRVGPSHVPELAVFLLAALFLSPISWFSHYVSVLVAYMVLVEAVVAGALQGRLAWLARAALGAAALLSATTWSRDARAWSPTFATHALVLGVLWVVAWRASRAERSAHA